MNKIYRTAHFFGGRLQRIYRITLESIQGKEVDYTSIRLSKAILLLSIPMILEMIGESIFAIADIWFVSKLGSGAVAVVGITESINTLVYALGFGLSMAVTATVARRIGAKEPKKAGKAASQGLLLGSMISLLIAIPGVIFAKDILALMGMNSETISEYSSYTTIILGSNLVIMLLFINNAIFRSAGDASISFRVLMFANIMNLILDPLFIFGLGPIPAMGIKGAAIATTTGRGLAVIYQLYLLFKGKGRIQINLKFLKPDFSIIRKLVNLATGGVAQNIIATASWIILMRIMANFGEAVVAGYTVAIRIFIFTLLPAWGVSNAAATLTGQNLGAGKPERAERAAWTIGKINMLLLGLIGIVLFLIPETLMGFFDVEMTALKAGAKGLRIMSVGMIAYGMGMVMSQSFNGAGDTRTPTLINFISFWIVQVPLAYLLAIQFAQNAPGVYIAIVVSEAILATLGVWIFSRGRWKLKTI